MRCIICDASSMGLSDYRPDRPAHLSFVRHTDGEVYCSECDSSANEVSSDFDLDDIMMEESDDEFTED